jgi:hypothetical protein
MRRNSCGAFGPSNWDRWARSRETFLDDVSHQETNYGIQAAHPERNVSR